MLETQLHNLGFHKNEIKVYLALFELGQCKAGDIILHTKLHRNLVYTALEELEKKELLTKTIAKSVAKFSANNPERLVEELENKKQLAQEIAKKLKERQNEAPREITVFEGIEGMKKFKEKSLNIFPDSTNYIISASSLNVIPELENFWREYHRKRSRRGIPGKFLIDQNTDKEAVAVRRELPHTELKYLPFGTKMPIWFEMFGDYLGIGLPSENPLLFSIKSREAVAGMKEFFNYFWNNNTTTLRGENGARTFIEDTLNSTDVYWIGGNSGIEKFYPQVWHDYKKQRVNKKVFWHDLIDPGMTLSSAESGKTIYDEAYYEYKFLPEAVAGPHVICIYGNKVANIVWKEDSVINIIEDEAVAESYKKYFNYLWNQETQILYGIEALKKLWLEAIDCGELRWIGARGYTIDNYPKIYAEVLKKAQNTPGIIWKNIIDPEFKGHALTKLPWVKTKYNLSKTRNPIPIWLFGNKVLIVNWAKKEPIIFVSTNKSLIQSYSDNFEELWNLKK
ncbi:MAG: hypothetical protein US42_C0008G0026 [Candidatus Magasanikbacteria bacterium GW2011_GWC2_37_14]|uniref:Transcription regulator TrmB N-terminal domain-containing protein n=1 Tax=Candidatus Magasanikbacteria bacterium GW2011_GWC2_37_14 TaxID=1619046 RepID=A0A0G0GMY0_9BACT|nr:MAG: hypothetical protein US42_C0008G0026 [Candidatus Magasanikbacteria bacterium GW2011_GWC2_37_14]